MDYCKMNIWSSGEVEIVETQDGVKGTDGSDEIIDAVSDTDEWSDDYIIDD
jgi:hypothetical protein